MGEDNISGMHRAYLKALDDLARARHREYEYKHSTYSSFRLEVRELRSEGKVEYSGRVETVDDPRFANWERKPQRVYYRLV